MVKKRVETASSSTLPRSISFPSSVFKDRSLSVLEALSEYLKDKKRLTYHEIAQLLNRDDRTIWTCYKRAKRKRENA